MKQILRYSFVALLAMICGNASSQTDELTWDKLLDSGKGSTYTAFEGKSLSSSAVYAGQISSGTDKYIQLRATSPAGIVTTASGGKIKSVTIVWNEATTADRTVSVYGKNSAYSGSADLYSDGTAGDILGEISTGDDNKTLTVSGSYTYIGIRSKQYAQFIDKITIVWEASGSTKTATTIEFTGDYETRATCGKDESVSLPTATVKAGETTVTGATVTWESNKTDIATVNGNKLNIANGTQGEVTIKASYAGDATYESSNKTYKLTVYKGGLLLSEMVKDVNSSNEKWDNGGELYSYWFVDDKLQSVPNTVTYVNGNYIYLTDGTNNLLFYGDNSQKLKQGDKISGQLDGGKLGAIWGTLCRYKKLPEFKFTDMEVKVESEGNAVSPKTITIDKLGENINAYVQIKDAEYVSANGNNLTFKVGTENFTVYNQFKVDVASLATGTKYTLEGMGSIYNTTYQLYLIKFDLSTNINIATADANADAPAYNLAGQKVDNSYKGLIIKNGRKMIQK